MLYGHPPQLIHLRTGNIGTRDFITLMRQSVDLVAAFTRQDAAGILVWPVE